LQTGESPDNGKVGLHHFNLSNGRIKMADNHKSCRREQGAGRKAKSFAAWSRVFLAELAATSNVSASAKRAGVNTAPSGDWSGQGGKFASRQAGSWLFTTPRDGMRLLNRANGQDLRFSGGWRAATRPAAPTGGTTVDTQARVAIMQLFDTLVNAGIFPAS